MIIYFKGSESSICITDIHYGTFSAQSNAHKIRCSNRNKDEKKRQK